jgi:ADP-ribose pyrophosphatase YjhB (NUDIX family)
MHPIQKQILYRLITNPCLPYSKIKPSEIEGNLFMYHLKLLIQQGLVQKRPNGKYELTAEGNLFADKASLQNLQPRSQPKIITLIVCQNKQGEFLLYRRKHQPLIGLIGFPYGKIHLGETILQAATRELQEKTGLSAKLTHRGETYLTTYKDQELISQIFCHVFVGQNLQGELTADSEIGECFWAKNTKFNSDKFIPGFLDICALIKKPSDRLFFEEFTYHL